MRLHAEGFPEAGRRKLDGRIISIEGESGAETITFDFFEVFIARTPTAAVTALRGRRKKTAEVPPCASPSRCPMSTMPIFLLN